MAQATAITPVFQGTAAERALGQRIFDLMTRLYGSLYARDALVRQSTANLAAFLGEQDKVTPEAMEPKITTVVRKNPQIFSTEERDGNVFISTSRLGVSSARAVDTLHTFRERLYEPLRPLPIDDMSNIVTTVRQPLPAPEPVLISPFWRGINSEPMAPVETQAAAPIVDEAPAPPVVEPVVEPVQHGPTVPVTGITLRDGTPVDLALPREELVERYGALIAAQLQAAFKADPLPRVVSFGKRYYSADALPTFGKNDLRRIRDFITEQGEPVLDEVILTDLYRERRANANFEMIRFALDYRLQKEKDFEFVGMAGANLWSAKGLAAIGGKRIKASDIGQLLGYLPDGYDDSPEDVADDIILHTLTFFEWEYGILPLDMALAAVMPQPALDDQRTAVIRIEYRTGQQYYSYLCEVRFPTGARGGWVWGLEEFFHEYLVPGVVISIARTEDANIFSISYDEAPAAEGRLLHLDEKRNKFVFMPVTYYAAVDEGLLPSQARYNKLRNLKALPMAERKKTDIVLTHVFETVGEQLGSKEEPLYWITFDELNLAMNVLRPVSQSYLAQLLSNDDAFYADETTVGAWYYKPAPEEVVAEASEDEEEDAILQYDEDDE